MILFDKKKVSNLQPHPLLGTSGMLDELSRNELVKSAKGDAAQRALREARVDELNLKLDSLQADIAKNGILEPIKICLENGEWLIVDGRHRWMAAKALNRETVPCALVDPKNAREIILSAMLGKHLSKGARAYSAVQVHPEVALDGEKREKAGKKLEPSAIVAEGLAQKIGVSERMMRTACALYKIFHEHLTLKGRYEDSVYTVSITKLLGDMTARVTLYEESKTYDHPQPKKETKAEREAGELLLRKAVTKDRVQAIRDFSEDINDGWELLEDEDLEDIKLNFHDFLGRLPEGMKAMASDFFKKGEGHE